MAFGLFGSLPFRAVSNQQNLSEEARERIAARTAAANDRATEAKTINNEVAKGIREQMEVLRLRLAQAEEAQAQALSGIYSSLTSENSRDAQLDAQAQREVNEHFKGVIAGIKTQQNNKNQAAREQFKLNAAFPGWTVNKEAFKAPIKQFFGAFSDKKAKIETAVKARNQREELIEVNYSTAISASAEEIKNLVNKDYGTRNVDGVPQTLIEQLIVAGFAKREERVKAEVVAEVVGFATDAAKTHKAEALKISDEAYKTTVDQAVAERQQATRAAFSKAGEVVAQTLGDLKKKFAWPVRTLQARSALNQVMAANKAEAIKEIAAINDNVGFINRTDPAKFMAQLRTGMNMDAPPVAAAA